MLKWSGHVMRREKHYIGRRAMEMKYNGKGREEVLREDDPEMRWDGMA